MKSLTSVRRHLTSALIVVLTTGVLGADVPRLIHYQGKLRDASGVGVNGSVTLRFRIYSHPTQASPVLFDETHSGVGVSQGLFNLLIGSETVGGVPDSALNSIKQYIGITVGGGSELSPRVELPSTAYALGSRSAEQLIRPGSFTPAVTVDETTGDVSVNSNKVTDVAVPTADNDAANKAYVDASGGDTGSALITKFASPGSGSTVTVWAVDPPTRIRVFGVMLSTGRFFASGSEGNHILEVKFDSGSQIGAVNAVRENHSNASAINLAPNYIEGAPGQDIIATTSSLGATVVVYGVEVE